MFGFGGFGEDKLPFMTLTYANGPGYMYHTNSGGRRNLTEVGITNYDFMHPATVPLVGFYCKILQFWFDQRIFFLFYTHRDLRLMLEMMLAFSRVDHGLNYSLAFSNRM